MKIPRKSGWSWNILRRLPDWILKWRISVLKKREQTEDISGEIADCEELLSFWAFHRQVKELYIQMWKEPFPEGPVWPRPIPVTGETIVISKKEMDKSYKDYEKRCNSIRKDFGL